MINNKYLNLLALAVSTLFVFGSGATVVSHAQTNTTTQVYKWKDKNGVTHYADKPNSPNLSHGVDVKVKRPTNDTEVAATPVTEKSSNDPTQHWETDENGNKIPPNKAAGCDVAKKNLSVLQDTNQVALKNDASGKPTVLDGAAKAGAIQKAQDDINLFCH